MNTKLIALASALVATASFAATAEAGSGVRLGFGGPLGTFVATPSHGGGGGSAYGKPAHKRKAPAVQAARKPEKPAPRIAKAEPVAPKATAEKTETTTGESARVTGSSALIQGSIPADEPTSEARETATPEIEAEAPPEPAVAAATESSDMCKKFIPAIGTTVSVGCGE